MLYGFFNRCWTRFPHGRLIYPIASGLVVWSMQDKLSAGLLKAGQFLQPKHSISARARLTFS